MKLKIGTMIHLENREEEEIIRYRSRVVDIASEDVIYIDYPVDVEEERTRVLPVGDRLHVSFVDEINVVYEFETEILGRQYDPVPMLQISYPTDKKAFKKIQRREYVRIETAVDVSLEVEGGQTYQLTTHDISAGGMALYLGSSSLDLAEGEQVEATIVLPFSDGKIQHERVTANVVRIFEKNNRPIASFQFEELTDFFRSEIVRFCFERQLQQRREERGIL